ATDRGGLVPLGKGRQDGLFDGRGKLEAGLAGRLAEYAQEFLPVLEQRIRQAAQEGADGILQLSSLGLLLCAGGTLLLGLGEVLERLLVFQSCDPFGCRLEVEPQRPLRSEERRVGKEWGSRGAAAVERR